MNKKSICTVLGIICVTIGIASIWIISQPANPTASQPAACTPKYTANIKEGFEVTEGQEITLVITEHPCANQPSEVKVSLPAQISAGNLKATCKKNLPCTFRVDNLDGNVIPANTDGTSMIYLRPLSAGVHTITVSFQHDNHGYFPRFVKSWFTQDSQITFDLLVKPAKPAAGSIS